MKKNVIVLMNFLLIFMLSMPVLAKESEISNLDFPVVNLDVTTGSDELSQNKSISQPASFIHLERNPIIAPLSGENNTNPNAASVIQIGDSVFDNIKQNKEQRWYLFQTGAGKLTAYLDFSVSQGVDYDLYLYQYNESDSTISLIASSLMVGTYEKISLIVPGGIYFLAVDGYSGYDAVNMYTLNLLLSSAYDGAEIDDTMESAQRINETFELTGTIDNPFDEDIKLLNVTSGSELKVTLKKNGSSSNIYRLDFYNSSGLHIAEMPQNTTGVIALSPGLYYLRVIATTYGNSASATYTLSGDISDEASSVKVTMAGDALISDYGHGTYYRIYEKSHVYGVAYDDIGNPMPNADITVGIVPKTINEEIFFSGKTNAQGKFDIALICGFGQGEYTYSVGFSTHYYDVIDVKFYSHGKQIDSNVDHFYHFAYELFH